MEGKGLKEAKEVAVTWLEDNEFHNEIVLGTKE